MNLWKKWLIFFHKKKMENQGYEFVLRDAVNTNLFSSKDLKLNK